MPSWGIIAIIAIVLLVALSAFFSGTETVFANVNKIKLEKLAKEGNKKADLANKLANNYPSLISTILIGNNLVNTASATIAGVLCTAIWQDKGDVIAMFGMTLIVLIFGEILPKNITAKYSNSLSLILAVPIKLCELIFKPIVFVITKAIDKLSPIWTPKEEDEETVTGEELINMIEEIEEQGFIDDDTSELVQSAIEFKDTTAHEIMTPRVDIFAYNLEDDINELIHSEGLFDFARVIVYEESIDNIKGFISTRKLLTLKLENKEINLDELITPVILVHKTKSISDLLTTFKETKTHIAVVVDEYGGTLGIVTLEDILEEIVGEIWDETDEIEEEYVEKSDTEFIIDGDMNIYDMFELIGLDEELVESDYETVGGWCTEILDDFPKENDTFEFRNLKVTILKVDGVRVENIRVEVINSEEEEKEE